MTSSHWSLHVLQVIRRESTKQHDIVVNKQERGAYIRYPEHISIVIDVDKINEKAAVSLQESCCSILIETATSRERYQEGAFGYPQRPFHSILSSRAEEIQPSASVNFLLTRRGNDTDMFGRFTQCQEVHVLRNIHRILVFRKISSLVATNKDATFLPTHPPVSHAPRPGDPKVFVRARPGHVREDGMASDMQDAQTFSITYDDNPSHKDTF